MGKLVFSSEQLPGEIDDAARFALWQELYVGTICHFDVKRLTDRPFAMRYVSERVLEFRLQKARDMLTDRKHDRMRIADIALACGFNEVSYFKHCFRRRFGATPTERRGDRRREP